MTATVTFRAATAADGELLVEMLLAAVNWHPGRVPLSRDQALAAPELARYVAGWPQPGELGVVAEADGEPVGVAWLRFFEGYGFVAPDIPELSIGVREGWRGHGIGAALLTAAATAAARAGIDRISLSVERANPAKRLYTRAGYVVVSADDTADTMLVAVSSPAGPRH